jgi:P-loop containing dynein motor region
LVAFIDDLNMPQVDEYGTQQPIAILKLLFDKGGMYDRGKDLNWKQFKDISKDSKMYTAKKFIWELTEFFFSANLGEILPFQAKFDHFLAESSANF